MLLSGAAVLTWVLIAQAPVTASEAASAQALLKKVDDVNNDYKDQEFITRMTLLSGGKVEKVAEMQILQKGGLKRLIRILKPADLKGLSVLVLDADTAYVYLPQFNKTRRVAVHTNKQSFMGSDFSEQEMSIIRYGDAFEPSLLATESDEIVLKLAPRKGKSFDFAWIRMRVDRKTSFINRLEYFGAGDERLKTQALGEVKKINGIVTQTKVVMTDHLKKHETVMEILDLKQDQGLKDDIFTTRALEWGK